MSCIVCATRGGAGSRAVQRRAIQHALKTDQKLIFLYVLDISGLDDHEELLTPAVRSELYWVGQVLLEVARRRAANAKVSSETVLREGRVQEEICHFLNERSPTLLLLGAPRGTSAEILNDDVIERFASQVKEETGVPVEIVRPEEDSGGLS